ncbi:hypothetical protein NHF48_001705 [Sphingomonas sp. H160509]|nr:hypothetical protein [Sphingomonas sp. H160509]MDD1449946.1 hypothetical protein [Sphingomonas sp. H160509]
MARSCASVSNRHPLPHLGIEERLQHRRGRRTTYWQRQPGLLDRDPRARRNLGPDIASPASERPHLVALLPGNGDEPEIADAGPRRPRSPVDHDHALAGTRGSQCMRKADYPRPITATSNTLSMPSCSPVTNV